MSKRCLFALAALLAAGAMEAEQSLMNCSKYTCNNDKYPMTNSTCAMYFNGTFYLQLCQSEEMPFCPPTTTPYFNSTCQEKPAPPVDFAWPGEACKSEVDCALGNCTAGICEGKNEGEPCEISDQCNPGFFCGKGICTAQAAIGMPCTDDYECVNNAGCNLSDDIGRCVQYLSLNNSDIVAPCSQNVSYLCGSGTCSWNGSSYLCIPEPESYAQPPLKCISDADCFSLPDSLMGNVLTSHCTCSYNPWGMSFCELFPGDEIGITLRKYMYTWFTSPNATKCNTKRRMSLECIQQFYNEEDYLWLAYHQIWYDEFSYVQFLDPCGQQIYQQDYWEIKYQFNHYDSDFTDMDDYNAGLWLHFATSSALFFVA